MKKMIARFLTLMILAALSVSTWAQDLPLGDPRNDEFRRHFIQVRALNPNVQNFNKMDVGASYNLPNNGTDALTAVDTNGIWGREFHKFYGISYQQFLAGTPASTPDPTTSGPPVVQGGIRPEETDRLRRHFDSLPNLTRVGPVEAGTISGEGTVGYSNGTTQHHVITKPMPAYQARYRNNATGAEEVIQTLQKCMNPVTSGGTTYRGFTFTPTGGTVVDAPTDWWPSPWWLLVLIPIAAWIGLRKKGDASSKTPRSGSGLSSLTSPVVPKSPDNVTSRSIERSIGQTHELQKGGVVAKETTHSKDEPEEKKVPKKPTQKFISFASSDASGPSMIRWNGVNIHSMNIDTDGTKTLRFTLDED